MNPSKYSVLVSPVYHPERHSFNDMGFKEADCQSLNPGLAIYELCY